MYSTIHFYRFVLHNHYRFCAKNVKMFVFSSNKQEHLAFTIFSAVRNAGSEGTDVPDIHKYFYAIVEGKGNCVL